MNDVLQIVSAFSAGVLSFFSPCVFGLIPVYICFITGLSIEEVTASFNSTLAKRKLILTEAILFILGFSLTFIALGASAAFLGSHLIAYKKLIRIIGGVIIIFFGLHMLGLLKIKFLEYEKRMHLKNKPLTRLGSFFVGMTFGLGWTPCVGPILGGILMLAATADTLAKGVRLLSSYSLGLALPFLLVGIGIKWMLGLFTEMKRYFKLISVSSGVLLVIIGITILLPQVFAGQNQKLKRPASDFTLPSIDGKTLRLLDFKGKVIILNFWATFCPPCRQEIPDFIKLYDKYKDQDLVIIGINLDINDPQALKEFCQDMKINYPVVKADAFVAQSYGGLRYIPATFIIDKEMNIVKEFVGFTSYETLELEVDRLLSGL